MAESKHCPGDLAFGKYVQKLREEQGLTQAQLVGKIGYKTRNEVNRYEQGRLRPNWQRYQLLSAVLCKKIEQEETLDRLYLRRTEPVEFHEFHIRPDFIRFLHSKYAPLAAEAGGELVEVRGRQYPVVFFKANGASIDKLLPKDNMDARESSAIATAQHDDSLAIREPAYRKAQNDRRSVSFSERDQTKGWNVCMTRLHIAKGGYPVTEGRLCEYGPVLDSCDCLRDELIWASVEKFSDGITEAEYDAVWEALPLRREIHEKEGNPLISAQHRAAAFGVSGAIVFKRRGSGQYEILTGKRSGQVATYQHSVSVVPSGMSNWRFTGNPRDSANPDGSAGKRHGSYLENYFWLALLDEYAEEAGGYGQLSDAKGDPADVLNAPFVQELFETHKAKIQYTGLAFDLLNLRPEVCFVMVIDDPEWFSTTKYEEKIQLNPDEYEIKGGVMYKQNPQNLRRNVLPTERMDWPFLMRYEHLTCALIELV